MCRRHRGQALLPQESAAVAVPDNTTNPMWELSLLAMAVGLLASLLNDS
jgi:hypothetical protein